MKYNTIHIIESLNIRVSISTCLEWLYEREKLLVAKSTYYIVINKFFNFILLNVISNVISIIY